MDVSARIIVAFFIGGMIAATASPEALPPEVLHIARAENTNREFLKRTPTFTCLETIDRRLASRKHPKTHKVDVVQVEVGVGAEREVYSWPGQHEFSDINLPELVGHGLVATGMFQTIASDLFVQKAGIVKFVGSDLLQGHSALRFSYRMPQLQSEWDIDWLGASGSVGETGEFWVDASDYSLLRLTAKAVDIPPSIPLSSLEIVIDYRSQGDASERSLLPELAQVNAVEINGNIHQNRVFFSHCHVFSSTSVLLSSPEDISNAIVNYEQSGQTLPGGLDLHLKLVRPIDSGSAKVGDSISAELENSVRLADGETIPKGALVKGYVRAFERADFSQSSYMIGLEFDEIHWADRAAAFYGKQLSFDRLIGASEILSRNEVRQNRTAYESKTETLTPPAIPGVATFYLAGDPVRLPRGFHMLWQTQDRSDLAPSQPGKQKNRL